MVYTVFYKASSFAVVVFGDRNSIHPKSRDVFIFLHIFNKFVQFSDLLIYRNKNIFSDIQAKTGCRCISDLPYLKRTVWLELKRLPLADYPEQQLENFSRYVFGVPYTVIAQVLQRKDVKTIE